jgi:hypothetical protein
MHKTPRLTDLYVVGKLYTVEVEDIKIPVWIQKMNPAEHQEAIINANGARAVVLSLKKQHDADTPSREYVSITTDIDDLAADRVNLIDVLALTNMIGYQTRAEAELASEEEWAKDDYYQSLVDAWIGEMEDRYTKNNLDPEALRVFDELNRFNDLVEIMVDKHRERTIESLLSKPDDVLYRQAVDMIIEARADSAWIESYKSIQLYFSVKDAQSREKYFESVEECKTLDPRVSALLNAFIDDLVLDPLEGKESQDLQDS